MCVRLVTVALAVLLDTAAPDPTAWWNNAVYYRISVDSFKDLDGDGLGDLAGATKQLSYVKALGADAVIISSILERSTDCTRPGVLNFDKIDPRYGGIETFNALIQKAKKLDLKLLITLDVETMSQQSDWFKQSAEKKAGLEDGVVWRDGEPDVTPQIDEGMDSWIWNEERRAFWASSENETILNMCSEAVVTSLFGVQCSWLKRGVSGVVLNPDFPSNIDCGVQLVKRLIADALSCARAANLDTPVFLVESSLRPEIAAKYYGEGDVGANSVISYALTTPSVVPAPDLALALHAALLYTPQDMAPAWLTSRKYAPRIMTRYGSDMVDSIVLLTLILPGAAIIQQGDELGAADTLLEWASTETCWPNKLIPSLAPFPWDDSPKGSFTSGEPWLPLAPNYRYANAKTEYANDQSHIGVMRVAAAMRKTPAIGPHVEIKRLGTCLAVLRWGGAGSLLYISNFGRTATETQLSKIPGLPVEMTVVAGSSFPIASHISTEKGLKLGPGEAVLLVGPPRHCSGPGPVDKIASKLSEGWQKINKYFSNL